MTAILDAMAFRAHALSGLLALGGIWAASVYWSRYRKIDLNGLFPAGLLAIAIGRLAWVVTTARPQLTSPVDVVRANTGIDMAVTAWAFVTFCLWFGRRRGSDLGAFAPTVLLLAPAIFAAACLIRLDCAGRVAQPPFGVAISGYSQSRLPIGLYEALALLLVLALIQNLRLSTRNVGPWLALAGLSLVEWTIEFGRIQHLSRATTGTSAVWLVSAALALIVAAARLLSRPKETALNRQYDQL